MPFPYVKQSVRIELLAVDEFRFRGGFFDRGWLAIHGGQLYDFVFRRDAADPICRCESFAREADGDVRPVLVLI